MASRTQMKQNIMREKAMQDDEKFINNSQQNISFYLRQNYHGGNIGNSYLPSLSATLTGDDHKYYCTPVTSSHSNYQFNQEAVQMDEKYYRYETEYVSNIDNNNADSSHFGFTYPDIGNNTGGASNVASLTDMYSFEPSCSCPVTGQDHSISGSQRRIPSSNLSQEMPSLPLIGDDKKIQLKDKSKKESHNRIERKRRDFINQQILELSNLIPSYMLSESESKKNKGTILKNSVDYIQHLQIETNNTMNILKENEMAFSLVELFRKRIQILEQTLKSVTSQSISSSPESQHMEEQYNNYIAMHDHNLRVCQTNGRFSAFKPNKFNSETNRRLSMKQPVSPMESNIAFKVEPSSGNSSIGNNSLSAYRIEEEVDKTYSSLHMLSPRNINQNLHNHQSLSSAHSDPYGLTNSHYKITPNHRFESMEC